MPAAFAAARMLGNSPGSTAAAISRTSCLMRPASGSSICLPTLPTRHVSPIPGAVRPRRLRESGEDHCSRWSEMYTRRNPITATVPCATSSSFSVRSIPAPLFVTRMALREIYRIWRRQGERGLGIISSSFFSSIYGNLAGGPTALRAQCSRAGVQQIKRRAIIALVAGSAWTTRSCSWRWTR